MFGKKTSRDAGAKLGQKRVLGGESLETRKLFSVNWVFSGGVLEGVGTAGKDQVVIATNSANNVTNNGFAIFDAKSGNNVKATDVKKIEVFGKAENDTIDLRAVDQSTFPALTGTYLHGDGKMTTNPGADTIFGSQFNDKIVGDAKADTIYGLGGNDDIKGQFGDDTIFGGDGNDIIDGGDGDDDLCGNDGDDTIYGRSGKDDICGGKGNDTLEGNSNTDNIWGGEGDDIIHGGAGKDHLEGGPGTDTLKAKENFIQDVDHVYSDSSDTVQLSKTLFGKDKDIEHKGQLNGKRCPCPETTKCDPGGKTETDFGDAPDSYGTTTTGTTVGASHRITAMGPRLGNFVDPEQNGKPSVGADEDDKSNRDDEDGVTFVGGNLLSAGTTESFQIDVQNLALGEVGHLSAWIDFNGNTIFDPSDKIASSIPVTQGVQTVAFNVPYIGTRLGPSYARFRISSGSIQAPTGLASDGEVEDYRVDIGCGCIDCGGGTVDFGRSDFDFGDFQPAFVDFVATPDTPVIRNLFPQAQAHVEPSKNRDGRPKEQTKQDVDLVTDAVFAADSFFGMLSTGVLSLV